MRVSLYQGASQNAPVGEERSLGHSAGRLHFRYFGPLQFGQAPIWQDAWLRTDRLPDLVEIEATPAVKVLKAPLHFRSELKLRPLS